MSAPKPASPKGAREKGARETPSLAQLLDHHSLEERLSAARLKREKVLARQASAARKPAAEAATVPPGTAAQAPEGGPRSRWIRRLGVSRDMVPTALLVFAVAAGLGFGIVLGLGVLTGAGKVPVRAAASAVTDRAERAGVLRTGSENAAQVAALEAPVRAQPLPERVAAAAERRGSELARSDATTDRLDPVSRSAAATDADAAPRDDPDLSFGAPGVPVADSAEFRLPEITRVMGFLGGDATGPALRWPRAPGGGPLGGDDAPKPAGSRVFMHAPDGVPEAKLRDIVTKLDESGVEVAEIGRERVRVSTTHLRFYSPATADLAKSVAAELGVEARDFSDKIALEDRIEIWIAGRPTSARRSGAVSYYRRGSPLSRYQGSGAGR